MIWFKGIISSKGKSFHLNAKCLSFRFIYSNYFRMLFNSCLYDDCQRSTCVHGLHLHVGCFNVSLFSSLVGMLIVPCPCIRYGAPPVLKLKYKYFLSNFPSDHCIINFQLYSVLISTQLLWSCSLFGSLPRELQSLHWALLLISIMTW